MIADQVRVMSIFSTNNFQTSSSALAVYATASRLNHSCLPNVHHSYNPTLKSITVHAVRDIHPSEELLTTYLGGESAYQVRAKRVEKLRAYHGFVCQCPACSDYSGASDFRRESMSRISWGLNQFVAEGNTVPDPFIPTHPLAALQQAEHLVTLLLTEGIVTIELTKAYRIASMQALNLKDFDRALEYAHDEAVVERNCLGTALKDLRKLGAAAECWTEKILDVVRVERGEEAVVAYRDAVKLEKKMDAKCRRMARMEKARSRANGFVSAGNGFLN